MIKQFGKKPRSRKFTPPKATRGGYLGFIDKPVEKPLTGQVQKIKAAQGEERFARMLDKAMREGLVARYHFRTSPGQPKQTPGWLELDYLIEAPTRTVAVSIKGAGFVHKGTGAKDRLDEVMLVERLNKMGYSVYKIETVWDYQLTTQDAADKVGKSLGVYK